MTEPPATVIHHLALADEWADAVARGGPYDRSTIGRSLADEGFIHCSFATQVPATANRFHRGRTDVVLLTIDPARLDAPLVVENTSGGAELFPHVYGPIPLSAVVVVTPVGVDPAGDFVFGAALEA